MSMKIKFFSTVTACVVFLVAALFFLVGCETVDLGREEPDFYLNISLHEEEISKDSSSSSTIVEVEGREVIYAWSTGGAEAEGPVEQSFRLSWEEYEELILLIRENWLNRSIDEWQPEIQTGTSVALRFEVRLEGESFVSTLVGMETDLVTGDGNGNLENIEYLRDVQALVAYVEEIK